MFRPRDLTYVLDALQANPIVLQRARRASKIGRHRCTSMFHSVSWGVDLVVKDTFGQSRLKLRN